MVEVELRASVAYTKTPFCQGIYTVPKAQDLGSLYKYDLDFTGAEGSDQIAASPPCSSTFCLFACPNCIIIASHVISERYWSRLC